MSRAMIQDFTEANAITIDTYQQIAPIYADSHNLVRLPAFWQEGLQRFPSTLHSCPASQANPALPALDMGCAPGRDSLLLAQMGFNVSAPALSPSLFDSARRR